MNATSHSDHSDDLLFNICIFIDQTVHFIIKNILWIYYNKHHCNEGVQYMHYSAVAFTSQMMNNSYF